MDKNSFSPYIRVAMFSTLIAPFQISNRIIFDYEIILVTAGKCKITIANKEYLCKKDDVVFLRPNIEHKFECIDNCDFVQPHIHFDIAYDCKSTKRFVSFKPSCKMSAGELALIQDDIFCDLNIPHIFTPYDMAKFKRIFFRIIEIFQAKDNNYELLYKGLMLELLSCILTQFETDSVDTPRELPDSVMMTKNYIDNNFLSVITLDFLSMQFHINKFTLMRNFRKIYRESIINYYRKKRIEYIKTALKSTSISITELSYKMNFTDIYSFSRFFKSSTGFSPSEYRKRL